MRFNLPSLFMMHFTGTLFVAASNHPLLNQRNVLSFNPGLEDMHVVLRTNHVVQEPSLTNARRFTLGLPPNPPRTRSTLSKFASGARPSGRPGQNTTGCLKICDASDGSFLGYVSRTLNSFGEYGTTINSGEELKIKVDMSVTGPVNLVTIDGPDADLPELVGITGFANNANGLHPGQYNYVYFGAGSLTTVGSTPRSAINSFSEATGNEEAIESAIFILEPALNIIPLWINGDGSKATTFLGLYDNVLFLTGDQDAFTRVFGPVTWVTMTFEADFD